MRHAATRSTGLGALRPGSGFSQTAFRSSLFTGQILPPYGANSNLFAADLLGLRAAWAKRPASALRKRVAPFLVLLFHFTRAAPRLRRP